MAFYLNFLPENRVYSGEYYYSFEFSYLVLDGQKEQWCIDAGSMSKAMSSDARKSRPWGRSHVVVRGKLGPKGSYGGLGVCKHILTVTDIIKVTNMRAGD